MENWVFVLFVHQNMLYVLKHTVISFIVCYMYVQGHMYYASIFFVIKNCTALFLMSYQLGSQGA